MEFVKDVVTLPALIVLPVEILPSACKVSLHALQVTLEAIDLQLQRELRGGMCFARSFRFSLQSLEGFLHCLILHVPLIEKRLCPG